MTMRSTGQDHAIVNARVHSMDAAGRTWSAVLIRDGRIVRAGTDADILAERVPGDLITDLGGQTVVPGLIDPHQHFSMACSSRYRSTAVHLRWTAS